MNQPPGPPAIAHCNRSLGFSCQCPFTQTATILFLYTASPICHSIQSSPKPTTYCLALFPPVPYFGCQKRVGKKEGGQNDHRRSTARVKTATQRGAPERPMPCPRWNHTDDQADEIRLVQSINAPPHTPLVLIRAGAAAARQESTRVCERERDGLHIFFVIAHSFPTLPSKASGTLKGGLTGR